MNWEQNRWLRRAKRWPEHMQALAGQLTELAGRVRESVGDLVGESIGAAVRDLMQRAWNEQRTRPAEPSSPWPRRVDGDHWIEEDIDHEWTSRTYAPRQVETPTGARPIPNSALLAVAMQAAGWWLRQRGSWQAALGLGCSVGSLAFLGGPIALAGLHLLEAAGDVYSLHQLLTASPDLLSRN